MKLNLCELLRRKRRSTDVYWMKPCVIEYSYESLKKATKNLSETIGTGLFGTVYRGELHNNYSTDCSIAVKEFAIMSSETMEDEVVLVLEDISIRRGSRDFKIKMANLRHINLLPIISFCYENDRRMHVFNYMPRRSLDLHIFAKKDEERLDWDRSYQIALGTARGLLYLHRLTMTGTDSLPRSMGLPHGNIKPENIILDSEFCPKLTDYCLWLFFKLNHWNEYSERTRSYIAPEILSNERSIVVSKKSDVYSYGMVLFEMISGVRNSENGPTPKSFSTRVASVVKAGGHDILSLLDDRLAKNADEEEVLRVCKLACWCIHDNPECRPSMEQVVGFLQGVLDDGNICWKQCKEIATITVMQTEFLHNTG